MVQKRLINDISEPLSGNETVNLLSWGHLKWTMQILGQAFRMPLDDISLKTLCKSIYFKWLLDDESQVPPAVKELRGTANHDQLLLKIVQHFSLAFEARSFTNAESGATESQIKQNSALNVNLCFDIVNGLFLIIRKYDLIISLDSWTVLLKVLFGIADTVLGRQTSLTLDSSQNEYLSQLSERLATPLTQLLFEALLRARYCDRFLWDLIIVK